MQFFEKKLIKPQTPLPFHYPAFMRKKYHHPWVPFALEHLRVAN